MPAYRFTVALSGCDRHTVTVTGPYAINVAHVLANSFKHANPGATIADPQPVDTAPTDANQPATDSELADGSGSDRTS